MSNCLVILVTDLYVFNIVMRNMARQTNSDLIIINETRANNKTSSIQKILDKYKIKAIIFESGKINKYINSKLNLTDNGKQFLEEYKMGMNINTQYFLLTHSKSKYKKILFIDDDVIINDDLCEIFDNEHSIFYRCFFCSGNDYIEHFKAWHKFTECSFKTWKQNYLASGQRLYVKTNSLVKEYKHLLEKFYNNEYFYSLWNKWQTTGKGRTAAFFQDQNFETALTIRAGINNDGFKKYMRIEFSPHKHPKNLKLYFSKKMLHLACGKHKNILITFLLENKLIK